MDFVYVAGPALASFMFAFFSVNTDPDRHPILRLLFMLASLSSLIVFLEVAQVAALYGETIPATELTSYTYNATGTLTNSSTAYTFTNVSPMVDTNYSNVWLILSATVWLVFAYVMLQLWLNALSWASEAIMGWYKKKNDGGDTGEDKPQGRWG
jgi:hypothetical protein